jgi:hypothetical protein
VKVAGVVIDDVGTGRFETFSEPFASLSRLGLKVKRVDTKEHDHERGGPLGSLGKFVDKFVGARRGKTTIDKCK